jgi:hypothetical protein
MTMTTIICTYKQKKAIHYHTYERSSETRTYVMFDFLDAGVIWNTWEFNGDTIFEKLNSMHKLHIFHKK